MTPPATNFALDLQRYGPGTGAQSPPALTEAQQYCRRLAHRHYENFTVASRLLPRELRQHFCNVYAYCRWADDLADETGDATRSLELLDWWEAELGACYGGSIRHPVFVALEETIRQFDIPAQPFRDLLVAFRQDQRLVRYETVEDLLGYCRYSANPVGHLVLYLGRCFSSDRAELADSVCTGLQLANFWQDVARDFDCGRVYLPQAECRRYGYAEADLQQRRCNDAFRHMLGALVADAENRLRRGWPLVEQVSRELKLDVSLFIEGGLTILKAIRAQGFDVWTSRPVVSRMAKLRIVASCWWGLYWRSLGRH